MAKQAPHGVAAGAATPAVITPAAARANLEIALAAALQRATEASGTHAGAWNAMTEVARAIQVALAAPAAPDQHEVVDLDAVRQRLPR